MLLNRLTNFPCRCHAVTCLVTAAMTTASHASRKLSMTPAKFSRCSNEVLRLFVCACSVDQQLRRVTLAHESVAHCIKSLVVIHSLSTSVSLCLSYPKITRCYSVTFIGFIDFFTVVLIDLYYADAFCHSVTITRIWWWFIYSASTSRLSNI